MSENAFTPAATQQPPDDRPGPDPSTGSRTRGALSDVGTVLGSYLVLGVLCGVLWWWLWEPAVFTKVENRGAMGELELSKLFNGDGWYTVVALLAGLAAGVALAAWRSRDLLLTTVLIAVCSGVAAALMTWTGHALGPGDPDAVLEAARPGTKVPVALSVDAKAAYLVWPMASLIGALVILWSPPKDKSAQVPAPSQDEGMDTR